MFITDVVGGALSNSLKDRDDVSVLVVHSPWHDGATINEDRRTIQSSQSDHAAGHILIATTDGNESIVGLAANHGFNRICDHFPGNQGVLHAFGSHRNAITDRDRVELHGLASGILYASGCILCQTVDVHVTRSDHAPSRSDANLGLLKIRLLEANTVQHASAGSAFNAFCDLRRILAMTG